MTDITPDLSICLQQKHKHQPILQKDYDLSQINSFLQEAYSINARLVDLTAELRAIRPQYLSTAPVSRRRPNTPKSTTDPHDRTRPLTTPEREAFDAQSKQLLRQLNNAISNLAQAEDVRNQTADSVALSKRARGGLGALGRWAAGGAQTAKSPEEEREEGARKTVAAVREGVVLFLRERLEVAGGLQGEMMEVRLEREVERSKSVLHKGRVGQGGIPYAHDEVSTGMNGKKRDSRNSYAVDQDAPEEEDAAQAQEQEQLFQEENNALLEHYNNALSNLATTERSILEISELHNTLHANLSMQSDHIEQLVQDSYITTENLDRGNKELKRASERRSTAMMVFWGTVGLCTSLVVWDLIF